MSAFECVKPTVIYDDLDTRVADFTFDFDAFYDMARSAGLNRDDIASYTLEYPSTVPRNGRCGDYSIRRRLARIYVGSYIERNATLMNDDSDVALVFVSSAVSRGVNDTTIHETGHHVDYSTNGEGKNRSRIHAATLAGCSAVTLGAGFLLENPLAMGVQLLGLGAIIGKSVRYLGYSNRPQEVVATKFERANASLYQITRLSLNKSIFT
ncbi:MAG TPA: hypothetical protein VLG37_05485 [Candidatus Saccharimonadales bacterium]|nr:hypothetical protein [Candidatus Saccharimonadales bacterium]